MLTRETLPPQAEVPQETVDVPELGGAVIVRGLDMPGLLRYAAARQALLEPLPGETEADAQERAGGALIAVLLAACVVLADGRPVYTAAQWSGFGARHPAAAMSLWRAVQRASGTDPDAEKKS